MNPDTILTAAGIQHRRARFLKPPKGTYAVYTDAVSTDGGDDLVGIFEHNVTIELYEPAPDDAAETAIESALKDAGMQYQKQDRYWLREEQVYQVAYDYIYYTKG